MSTSMSFSRIDNEETRKMEQIRQLVEGMLEKGDQKGSEK